MAAALEAQGRQAVERFLEEWERIEPGSRLRDRIHVLIGHGVVEDQIAHWAQARGADLIVMSTHGWSGLLRWMLGSVAHHMLQAAPCPVLTVGPEAAGPETSSARG
jgi:nucleotide-binding universal stress UspA family protein